MHNLKVWAKIFGAGTILGWLGCLKGAKAEQFKIHCHETLV